MKAICVFLCCALLGTGIGLIRQMKSVRALRVENAALQEQLRNFEQVQSESAAQFTHVKAEFTRLRAQEQELARLRGEVTQLRTGSKDAEKLRGENQQLRAENQQLRASASVPAPATGAAPNAASAAAGHFPREAWTFAGYSTPEHALITAIWAMREGNPRTYFESLSAEEQARMTQAWENKSAEEIAATHQSNVSRITSLRVLEQQQVSPEEMTMSVYVGGVDRMEKVSMRKVGEEWKFGGFIRGQQ